MMIEIVKNKIWNLLRDKEISLALICDRNGKILWHTGRNIEEKAIDPGVGFCGNYLEESLTRLRLTAKGGIAIAPCIDSLPNSAISVQKENLIIRRLNSNYFLYIDNSSNHSFIESELMELKSMGELLAEIITRIAKNERDVGEICGKSEIMKEIKEEALSYSTEEEPVLLLGETGVGKSHIAELIHHNSGRRGKFVVANAPTLQENLFESIFFGHRKGAFTDAKFDKKGLVEEAIGGTVFIDEVSEMPVPLQSKFLRFIESKKYLALGESFEREADVRVIASSNRNLAKAIEAKEFREDLYYRLNILEITIPPLRERKEDIECFVREKQHYLRGKKIGEGFMKALNNHEWPGNIRELLTVLKRAGICAEDPINGKDIQNIINKSVCVNVSEKQNSKTDQIWDALKSGKTFWEVVKKPFLSRDINRFEVKEIVKRGLVDAFGKYKDLIKIFNLTDQDYHKFMTFLSEYKLRWP